MLCERASGRACGGSRWAPRRSGAGSRSDLHQTPLLGCIAGLPGHPRTSSLLRAMGRRASHSIWPGRPTVCMCSLLANCTTLSSLLQSVSPVIQSTTQPIGSIYSSILKCQPSFLLCFKVLHALCFRKHLCCNRQIGNSAQGSGHCMPRDAMSLLALSHSCS